MMRVGWLDVTCAEMKYSIEEHALAPFGWQQYVSDQNTVTKYRPPQRIFYMEYLFDTLSNPSNTQPFILQSTASPFALFVWGSVFPIPYPMYYSHG